MAALDELRAFSVEHAELSLWVFRRTFAAGKSPKFRGSWIETTSTLDEALRATVSSERAAVEEVEEYSLLAQNNEGSALSITSIETHAGLLVDQASVEVVERKITKLKQLQNVPFYAIKMVWCDKIIFAVSRTGLHWRTRKEMSVFFSDAHLDLDTRQTFEILRSIDFFIVNDTLLIRKKAGFEAILNYKEAHKDNFFELQAEVHFSTLFVDVAPLIAHVGENKIQLRRMSAIRQKGHYKNPKFMTNVRIHAASLGLALTFDDFGKIIVTQENCRDVMTALLDHRLASSFSNTIYDVPNTTVVKL